MSDISASAVASLRARTGVSILECKKALEEAGGDEEKAIEILRARGQAQAVKKADREQHEGYVFSAESAESAALIVLHCETDFVSRDDQFQALGNELAEVAANEGEDAVKAKAEEVVTAAVQKLGENITLGDVHIVNAGTLGTYVHTNGKIGVVIGLDGGSAEVARDVAMHAAAMNPMYVTPEEVTDEDVAKEKELWEQQLADEGKPADIIGKIMEGKEKKFREENALISQQFVKDPSITIQDHLAGASISHFERSRIG